MSPPNKNSTLGRGLSDLFNGIPATIASAATISSTGFVRLSPDLIGLAPSHKTRAQEVTDEFVESVRTHGILQPILVRRLTEGYEVVVGGRRLVAARLVGLKDIPAVIVQATDEQANELSKIENTCREHLAPASSVVVPAFSAETIVEPKYWTPARVSLFCGAAILLLIFGAGVGREFGRKADSQGSTELTQVPTSRVVEPVAVPVAEKEAPRPVLDVSELKALEEKGLALLLESNGMAQVKFAAPLFSSRAILAPEGTELLTKLGAILSAHGESWTVVVTGHTDATPMRGSGLYRDNKELGLARAIEVVRYLMREAKVPVTMLSAATAGADNPPYPGDDAEARRKNRTVTLQIQLRE